MTDWISDDKDLIGAVAIDDSSDYDGKIVNLDGGGIYFESNEIVE